MRAVDVEQLKEHISEYLSNARLGETILIRDQGTTVAQLTPPASGSEGVDARLTAEEQDLVADGLMRPRKHLLNLEKLRNLRKEFLLPENSAIRAIIDDRNEGL